MQKRKKKDGTVTLMYGNQVSTSVVNNLGTSLIPYEAMYLNFSSAIMGILQAITNLFPNLFQRFWGKLADQTKQYINFVVIGSIVNGIALIFLLLFTSPLPFLIILSVSLIIGSMATPAWSSLVGTAIKANKKDRFITRSSIYGSIAGIIAMVGFMFYSYNNNSNVLILPFAISAAVAVGGSVTLLLIKIDDKKNSRLDYAKSIYKPSKRSSIRDLMNETPEFKPFIQMQLLYNLGMSIAWPLFYITIVKILHANYFQITIINILSAVSPLIVLFYMEEMIYKFGMKKLILMSRFLFVLVPLSYGLAFSLLPIYIVSIVVGPAQAVSNVIFFAYILHIAPENKRAEYWGTYNTLIGIVTFIGSIASGLIVEFLTSFWGLYLSLLTMYMASTVLRFSGAMFGFKIKDIRVIPSVESKDLISTGKMLSEKRLRWLKRS